MAKVIFGFTGLPASGKTSCTEYIKKNYDVEAFKFSQILRDTLSRLHTDISRKNLVKLSVALRDSLGNAILSQAMLKDINNSDKEIVIVEGIRTLEDVEALKTLSNFVLVGVKTKPEIRYKRLTERRENLDDETKTREQFQKDEALSTETDIPKILDMADEFVDNNDDLRETYAQIDKLIKKYAQ